MLSPSSNDLIQVGVSILMNVFPKHIQDWESVLRNLKRGGGCYTFTNVMEIRIRGGALGSVISRNDKLGLISFMCTPKRLG